MPKIKLPVFLPPAILLVASMLYSLYDPADFLVQVRAANDWILYHFGWLFSGGTLVFLLLCVWIYFSPLAKVRIGGKNAQPILTRWQWFSITLCTTIAIGILFWATAEPLYHLHTPPGGIGVKANSPESARFAMSTMFLHWTFTPYSIYTIAGLMFAIAYYNLKQPFSLGSMLFPLIGERKPGAWSHAIDAICLYSLVAGMAASLGAGILTVAGGMERFFGLKDSPMLLLLIAMVIVASFIISAITGLFNGIRILSNINTYAFFVLALFVLVFGPTRYLFQYGIEGMGDYASTFFPRSLSLKVDKSWADSWTVFYWANWLAWTPVTALFLGRVAIGYTVRDFIHYNLILPSLFSVVWMVIFSGSAIHMDFVAHTANLYGTLQSQGPESVIYGVLDQLPLAELTGLSFLATAFLSYVAGADANTSAMSSLSSSGISPESPEAPVWIKIVWGSLVGLIAWVMVANAGIEGIKMASTLGGFPALFLVLAVALGLVKILLKPGKYMLE
ncbi:MAG TPA: BCCT family transporter [Haliscomenobacter sp.]|uniref:BCCT family transporter n=1 Tax=Haliscomenobacter sp. TaxID=2717303 RepID=UPI002D088372|nr:BCCT family transporter [Haliscomenobacter sp.]HOY20830.1 BCCT family transporter [Haliscomenobacter sp.]